MNQLEELDKVLNDADKELNEVSDLQTLQQKKANFLGKKGPIATVMMAMKDLSVEAKKELGMKSNRIKQALEEKFEAKRKAIEDAFLHSRKLYGLR